MASFQTQVMGLTDLNISSSGTNPTEAQLTQFLTDGSKEIINTLPPNLLDWCASQKTFTSVMPGSEAETMNTGKILRVYRNDGDFDRVCRRIRADEKGYDNDPDEMGYASVTDPVFYTENNQLNALPEAGSCKYDEVQYPAVAYSDDAIAIFPDEAEYLVVLYGAVKSLQNVLGSKSSNSDITTALAAIKAELDETQGVCDKIDADLVLAKAEVVLAKAEAAELATQTDNSSDFATALTAINTELDKVDDVIVEASTEFDKVDEVIIEGSVELDKSTALLDLGETDSEAQVNTALVLLLAAVAQAETAADEFDNTVFGDEDTFLTASSQLTRVKAAVDNAEDVINSDQPSSTTDAYGALAAEDTEIVTSALSIAASEISRAQAHLSEWTAIGDMRVKEVNTALAEADGQVKVIQAHISQASAKRAESQSRLSAGNAYLQEATSIVSQGNAYIAEATAYISQAQGYASEVSSRAGFSSAKTQAIQGHISTAQAYVSTAQGFGSEIQSKTAIAQAYGAEIQSRLAVDTAHYGWYEKQQAKLQADYEGGIKKLLGGYKD
jgi:chromosome segregation ATPase